MRLALEEERKGRELLVGELAKTREAAGQQQALLSEREKQVQTFRQELQQQELSRLRARAATGAPRQLQQRAANRS